MATDTSRMTWVADGALCEVWSFEHKDKVFIKARKPTVMKRKGREFGKEATCAAHRRCDSPNLPRIGKTADGYVSERLEHFTPALLYDNHNRWVQDEVDDESTWQMYKTLIEIAPDQREGILKAVAALSVVADMYRSRGYRPRWDLHAWNLMRRADGTVVLNDVILDIDELHA